MARILLIDDEPDVHRMVELALEEHEVVSASDWSQIHARFQEEGHDPIELVLVDLNMPSLKGNKIAEVLRRERPALKIVLFSAADTSELNRMARQIGVTGALPKTFEARRLCRKVNRFLRKPVV